MLELSIEASATSIYSRFPKDQGILALLCIVLSSLAFEDWAHSTAVKLSFLSSAQRSRKKIYPNIQTIYIQNSKTFYYTSYDDGLFAFPGFDLPQIELQLLAFEHIAICSATLAWS